MSNGFATGSELGKVHVCMLFLSNQDWSMWFSHDSMIDVCLWSDLNSPRESSNLFKMVSPFVLENDRRIGTAMWES